MRHSPKNRSFDDCEKGSHALPPREGVLAELLPMRGRLSASAPVIQRWDGCAPCAPSQTKRRVYYFVDENIGIHASSEASLRKPHSARWGRMRFLRQGIVLWR